MHRTAFLLALTVLAGCGQTATPEPEPDAGLDAASEAPFDAGSDAFVEPDANDLDAYTFDGGPDAAVETCLPSQERTRRMQPCGCDGYRVETCTSGVWVQTEACTQCTPGEVVTETDRMCGVRQRTCSSTCTWSDWFYTVLPGECEPGFYQCSGTGTNCDCNDECMCEPIPGCWP